MEPIVKSLTIKRFRSIPAEHVEFDNPVFFVGKNGSGKSNFVDVFAFLAEAMVLPLQAVFDKRGGISAVRNRTPGGGYPPNVGLRVGFGPSNGTRAGHYAFEVRATPNYGFEVVREQCLMVTNDGAHWFDRDTKKFRSNVSGLEPALERPSLGLPVVGGNARFAPALQLLSSMRVNTIEPTKLREMQDPDSGTSLRADGSNAASVLQAIERHSHADLGRICELLGTIVPQTKGVRVKKHGNKISLEFTQEWGEKNKTKSLKFEAFNMSDGTLRALGLLAAVYQFPRPSLLAIEEPEATIHPGALGPVLDLLRHASKLMQVVVTTHSPEILDAKWISDNHLRVVDWQKGATRIARLSNASREALKSHLMGAGELLRSNALDGDPTVPLFQEHPAQQQLFEDLT